MPTSTKTVAVDTKLFRKGVDSVMRCAGLSPDRQKTADKYKITRIDQLKDPKLAKLFDSQATVADLPAATLAGLRSCTSTSSPPRFARHRLHAQGTYSALIADTITRRFQKGQLVLYYTWTPVILGQRRAASRQGWSEFEAPFSPRPASSPSSTPPSG
jgi:glycine betaine/proline transport system substrate-binding protein